jgi:glycosyltransferase involved in cell wall biosynthesis
MRVGLNAGFLGQQGTGSGQYAWHLLGAVAEADPGVQYLPFARIADAACAAPSLRPVSTPFSRSSDNLDKLWFEQLSFPHACRQAKVDVCHVPYFAPPLFSSVPVVVTIHDLIPLLLPAYRGPLWVQAYMRLVSAAARRADQIITDSQASKADIIERLRIRAERVHVIYLGVDPAYHPAHDDMLLTTVRARYGLPSRYILYLGGFDQRKNLNVLLRAYQRVLETLSEGAPALVVAGRPPTVDTQYFPDPKRIARELGIERHVVFTGWVDETDKPALYSAALFLAFLSLYEGFGLMPLEAMACGLPVLAAHRSSLPEVVGDGGLLVDPTRLDAVSEAMLLLIRDAGLRETLSDAALVQAARFGWDKTARETLRVYALAAAK